MATFYVDPVGGNDANDGTTFANRWQTFTTGATAARIAPGDVIRVIGSPDPTSMGQNATWTDGSAALTLTSAVTSNITLATSAWTASTNVTSTTSTNRKEGAQSSQIAINATFTTGKAAYLNLGGAQDLSAYQQVSFWINMTVGSMTADGDITLRLCSDTTGDVTVHTITVPRIRVSANWQAYTVDLGSALSSSIQSIALYVAVDRGAQTFLIDNVLACKSPTADDSLTLTSLISKNTGSEPWLGITSINGTAVTLEFNPNYVQPNNSAGYAGSTETVTCYKREALQLPSALVASTLAVASGQFDATDSGTAGSPITYSGGWNRTDMSTQTGDTYISGVNGGASGFYADTKNYIVVDKINPTRFYYGMLLAGYTTGVCGNISVTTKDINNNALYGVNITALSGAYSSSNHTINVTNIQGNGSASSATVTSPILSGAGVGLTSTATRNTINVTNVNSNAGSGVLISYVTATAGFSPYENYVNVTNLHRNGLSTAANVLSNGGVTLISTTGNNIIVGSASNNYKTALIFSNGGSNNFVKITSGVTNTGTVTNGNLAAFGASSGNTIDLTGVTNSNTSGNWSVISTTGATNNKVLNGTYVGGVNGHFGIYDSSSVIAVNPTISTGNLYWFPNVYSGGNITVANFGNSTSDQRTYYRATLGSILTDATVRHTASGISWKITSEATAEDNGANANNPLCLPVAKIACNASTLVTAKVWVYRTSTSLTTKFVCPGSQIAGVSSDVVATAAGAINTWEELTITFTPTQQGVVQLEVQCYGAAASVYVDDFSVSQA